MCYGKLLRLPGHHQHCSEYPSFRSSLSRRCLEQATAKANLYFALTVRGFESGHRRSMTSIGSGHTALLNSVGIPNKSSLDLLSQSTVRIPANLTAAPSRNRGVGFDRNKPTSGIHASTVSTHSRSCRRGTVGRLSGGSREHVTEMGPQANMSFLVEHVFRMLALTTLGIHQKLSSVQVRSLSAQT